MATKTITRTGNISFTDTENDASEVVVNKRQFFDNIKHSRFVVENCKKRYYSVQNRAGHLTYAVERT